MAYAGIDYHMDFASLLSLSNIGVVEPEIHMTSKPKLNGYSGPAASTAGIPDVPPAHTFVCNQFNGHNHLLTSINKNGMKRRRGLMGTELEAPGSQDLVDYSEDVKCHKVCS